jgi:hypothetical protein
MRVSGVDSWVIEVWIGVLMARCFGREWRDDYCGTFVLVAGECILYEWIECLCEQLTNYLHTTKHECNPPQSACDNTYDEQEQKVCACVVYTNHNLIIITANNIRHNNANDIHWREC